MVLRSLLDFVLKQNTNQSSMRRLSQIIGYAEFLKKPLRLEMFVPCDLDGNVYNHDYKEPIPEDYWSENGTVYSAELYKHDLNRYKDYKQAKERVLFKNCTFDGIDIIINNSVRICSSALTKDLTIEFLIYSKISLTKSAIKQFM